MDRKAVLEVRKLFDKNDCRIDRMRGCYVNGEKQILAEIQDSFYSFEDEELFQYCELFKKAVSGRIGRTLFNIEFPLAEEKEGGAQEKLYRLLKSELKDEVLLQAFFQEIIENFSFAGNYLILLVHGVYDIPGRTKDRVGLSDGSEYVYPFLELSICPVELLREGLCYDAEAKSFLSRMENWSVKKPDIGLREIRICTARSGMRGAKRRATRSSLPCCSERSFPVPKARRRMPFGRLSSAPSGRTVTLLWFRACRRR